MRLVETGPAKLVADVDAQLAAMRHDAHDGTRFAQILSDAPKRGLERRWLGRLGLSEADGVQSKRISELAIVFDINMVESLRLRARDFASGGGGEIGHATVSRDADRRSMRDGRETACFGVVYFPCRGHAGTVGWARGLRQPLERDCRVPGASVE
jgi:hypothetical protein